MRHLLGVFFSVMLLIGCGGQEPTEIGQEISAEGQACFGVSVVKVMTRNMYVGTDLDPVIAAVAESPEQVPLLAAQAWGNMLATQFAERAAAMADEIKRNRPHLIGLQEVSLIRTQFPGDAVIGGTIPATDVAFDFLATLLDELSARGLSYEVAAQVQNFDAELPRINPDYSFTDVRLTDFDVILARSTVDTSNAVGANYSTYLPVPGVPVYRGWVAVDAKVKNTTYRFVNTHLESAHPLVRAGQAQELTMILAAETKPLIVVGDFNSEATVGTAYMMMVGEGYTDIWDTRIGFPSDGFTCCQEETLANAQSQLATRIDFVFVRNMTPTVAAAWTTGDEPWWKTSSGLWPSDHAGVVAWMMH